MTSLFTVATISILEESLHMECVYATFLINCAKGLTAQKDPDSLHVECVYTMFLSNCAKEIYIHIIQ